MTRTRDHPRSRGVYRSPGSPKIRTQGSSPLARGLPPEQTTIDGHERIIPARAGFTAPVSDPAAVRADHPRSRGVYACRPSRRARVMGSSPLARGLHRGGKGGSGSGGIIPARAGFTGSGSWLVVPFGDHPRSRGVYAAAATSPLARSGSSPLARGLRGNSTPSTAPPRIIPARAGFTAESQRKVRTQEDHPRSRGVYMTPGGQRPMSSGSSPLARGLPSSPSPINRKERIIPARAGFTAESQRKVRTQEDHPRSRGVYMTPGGQRPMSSGSSPLARGLPSSPSPINRKERIIPARAGFTGGSRPRGRTRRDHPRSRGVYCYIASAVGAKQGSSPLARGLPLDATNATAAPRIIPARAGFTACASRPAAAALDHPRSRGVYRADRVADDGAFGSSPLARGLPATVAAPAWADRIIPARAGFTGQRRRTGLGRADHPRSRGVYRPRHRRRARARGSSPLARGLPFDGRDKVQTGRIIPARAGFTPLPGYLQAPDEDHPRSRGVYGLGAPRRPGGGGSSPLARGLHPGGRG